MMPLGWVIESSLIHTKSFAMNVILRSGKPEDAISAGVICYEAFKAIAEQHNFPPDFPTADVASGLLNQLLAHPDIYSVVAEIDGRVVGSNFLWEQSVISGVGPITVDPTVQNSQIGRALMDAVLARAHTRGFAGVRALL